MQQLCTSFKAGLGADRGSLTPSLKVQQMEVDYTLAVLSRMYFSGQVLTSLLSAN